MTRGNLPLADEMLGRIVEKSRAAECRTEQAMALHSQSVVAQRRGDLERAVCLSYESLQMTDAPSERDRVLGDIGAYFIVMARYDAARDALLVLEATTTVETVRWNARVNVLSLAARSEDRDLFEGSRRQLEDKPLPPETRVNYLIESARGFREFGQPELAAGLLEDARTLATAHGLHRSAFEAEQMLSSNRIEVESARREIRPLEPDPAAHVVQELRRMAAAVAA
jgi:hypothetical protein